MALALSAVLSLVSAPAAVAQPAAGPVQGAHITGIEHVNERWDKVSVFSPSMNKVIVNDVFKAPGEGAPTFYLLPGIDGGDDLDPGGTRPPGTKSWFGMTDIQGFSPARTSMWSRRSEGRSVGTPTGWPMRAGNTRPT